MDRENSENKKSPDSDIRVNWMTRMMGKCCVRMAKFCDRESMSEQMSDMPGSEFCCGTKHESAK